MDELAPPSLAYPILPSPLKFPVIALSSDVDPARSTHAVSGASRVSVTPIWRHATGKHFMDRFLYVVVLRT
ncbi:MAG TPA: hypothetical protein VHT91_10670 [Kofleriaceae bacterium]|nr:hypothetical protein [Kofleriaceae bacterium]